MKKFDHTRMLCISNRTMNRRQTAALKNCGVYTEFVKMADACKRSGVSYRQHGVEAFQDTKHYGGSVISSDTMSSVSLCENDIPGSSLDRRNPC